MSWASRATLDNVLTSATLSPEALTKISLQKIFSCAMLSKYMRQHCTRKLLVQCQPRVHRHRFAGKYPMQCCLKSTWTNIVQGMLPVQCWPTVHSPVSVVKIHLTQCCVEQICAMLAESAHSFFHRKITYTTVLSWPAWVNIAQEIICAVLTHSPQTSLRKKITYDFVWIYLDQHYTRKLQCLWGKVSK